MNWREWTDATLREACLHNRPIFVSIGYSACHWCHVMAREAFSDRAVAEILNNNFFPIKVDREERPDIDQIMQTSHQALTGQAGGWPLNSFLEPKSLMPFFSGTYYPLHPRYGLPSFTDVLQQILSYYNTHHSDVIKHGIHLSSILSGTTKHQIDISSPQLPTETLDCFGNLTEDYDPEYGGFGSASKFPLGPRLTALLKNMPLAPDPKVLRKITDTLDQIGKGGLQDHIGGGFFRYTMDREWRFPHFEKMLFDNAQLLSIYAEAASRFNNTTYREIVHSTVNFMEEDFSLPNGGYAASRSSETADGEGRYYLWDYKELHNTLTAQEFRQLTSTCKLNEMPSLGNLVHIALSPETSELNPVIKKKLKAVRANRTKPARDDKRITSWNALAITGLARAALFLQAPRYAQMAENLFEQLMHDQWTGDTLYSCAISDMVYQPAFLEDYAFLAQAALDLNPVANDSTKTILIAQLLMDAIIKYFLTDSDQLSMTSTQVSTTPYRPRRYNDDALPSGAGVALSCLMNLGSLCRRPDYIDTAHRILTSLGRLSQNSPTAYPTIATAKWESEHPRPSLVLRGDSDIADWLREATASFPGARITHICSKPPPSLDHYGHGSMTQAYICVGTTCSAPLKTPVALRSHSLQTLQGMGHGSVRRK